MVHHYLNHPAIQHNSFRRDATKHSNPSHSKGKLRDTHQHNYLHNNKRLNETIEYPQLWYTSPHVGIHIRSIRLVTESRSGETCAQHQQIRHPATQTNTQYYDASFI